MLIGNNIALVVYGFGVFTDESDRFVRISLFWLIEFAHSDSLVYLIVLMTAEFLPKVFSNLCQWFNQIFALPAYVFYLFYFISSFLISVSDFVLKKFFGTDGIRYSFILVKSSLEITLPSKWVALKMMMMWIQKYKCFRMR
jgi:hypothetical protein